jgi:hypothetical protein
MYMKTFPIRVLNIVNVTSNLDYVSFISMLAIINKRIMTGFVLNLIKRERGMR